VYSYDTKYYDGTIEVMRYTLFEIRIGKSSKLRHEARAVNSYKQRAGTYFLGRDRCGSVGLWFCPSAEMVVWPELDLPPIVRFISGTYKNVPDGPSITELHL